MHPTKDEMEEQYPFFAQHKHDQPILTALAYKYKTSCVLPELSETCGSKVAIYASRIRAKNWSAFIIIMTKSYFRRILGKTLWEKIKKWIR